MQTLDFDRDTRRIPVGIDVIDDLISERMEIFGVDLQLDFPDSSRITISPDSATVTILDNESEL